MIKLILLISILVPCVSLGAIVSVRGGVNLVTDNTKLQLTLFKKELSHGEWNYQPDRSVTKKKPSYYRADSGGVGTGTEGSMIYVLPDGQGCQFYFDAPFLGSASFSTQRFNNKGSKLPTCKVKSQTDYRQHSTVYTVNYFFYPAK